ncbi:MAG TPA: RidA family protein [Solirubrobacteraceae bacterium]|jgi:enamine deaminase RidA (YjgF/YER057c/UK114 family)|nr:RidA family protein [Solirubrobacteraceae bacterium]
MGGDRNEFFSPATLAPPFGWSHAASVAPGRVVWIAGQLPVAADGTPAPAGDMAAQTRQCFQNVGRALEAAGARWPDVVKLTYFVTDMSGVATIRAVRDEFVDTARPPTSSLVGVAGLVLPDAMIEIEAVACPPD